jgi:hypothetical protein
MLRLATFVTSVPSDGSSSGAVFGLLWGLFATPIGLLLASNYRGFLDRFLAASEASAAPLRRIPPWRWIPDDHLDRQRRQFRPMARVVGCVFAVVGPLVLVVSAIQLATGPWRPGPIRLHPHVTVMSVIVGVVMFAGGGAQLWLAGSPGMSPLRDAWRQGRTLPRLAAAGTTFAMLVMTTGAVTELLAIFMLGWAVAIVPAIVLILTWHRSPAAPSPTSPDGLDQERPTDSSAG